MEQGVESIFNIHTKERLSYYVTLLSYYVYEVALLYYCSSVMHTFLPAYGLLQVPSTALTTIAPASMRGARIAPAPVSCMGDSEEECRKLPVQHTCSP